MDSTDIKLKMAIAKNMGDVIEGILRKKKPFDKIPIQDEAALTFLRFCEYEKYLEEDFKTLFLLALITKGRFFCEKRMIGHHGKTFAEQYPEHKQIRKEFWDMVRKKEGVLHIHGSPGSGSIKKALVNKCVKETIKNRHPDFKLDNKAFGSIGFFKEWENNNKIYMIVDTGSWRRTLTMMLGVHHPKFCMDVSDFFADSQSGYGEGYHSVEQVKEATNKALDLVDALMPHFLNAIEKAFIENGLQV